MTEIEMKSMEETVKNSMAGVITTSAQMMMCILQMYAQFIHDLLEMMSDEQKRRFIDLALDKLQKEIDEE